MAAPDPAQADAVNVGPERIHFKKESDPRRRSICSALCDLEVIVAVYDATRIRNPLDARADCLTAAVEDLAGLGHDG